MFNLYKDKFIFEMPWLIWQRFETLEVFKSENMKRSKHSDYIAQNDLVVLFFKAMSFETLLIYKWSKHILHYHQFQILNRDEIISWKASFREFAVGLPRWLRR